ncbi:MAG: LysR substrate-binding domain-containing protein, partial [Pseudomonadota bacterium]|nr:LysR substrate-binding domain-containing protein [Pseudomonadota bacterium]
FPLASGVVARELAPVHIVAVASPAYMTGRAAPRTPADLATMDGIMRRSSPTGRVRPWVLRSRRGAEQAVQCRPRLIFSDPEAIAAAARLGLGVALVPMPFAFMLIASVELVRLLPGWHADSGRSRSTTRAGECCRRRPAPSSTSSWRDFDRRVSNGWWTVAERLSRVTHRNRHRRYPFAISIGSLRPDHGDVDRTGVEQRPSLHAGRGADRLVLLDRQATLRAAFDWSWDTLAEVERLTLAQLSVFEQGWTLE